MSPKETEIVVEIESTLGRFKVHVGELVLPVSTEGDGTPRMLDIEWARMLGFERPINIRKLIRNMIKDHKLRDVRFISAAEINTNGTRVRGRPGTEFWLTREQCFRVASQSNAPNAWNLTELMINVFEAVLKLGGVDAVRAALDGAHAATHAATRPASPPRPLIEPLTPRQEFDLIEAGQLKLDQKRALWEAEKLARKQAVEAEMLEFRRTLEAQMLERQRAVEARMKRKS